MNTFFIPLALTSEPWTILIDIIFIVTVASVIAWYFYSKEKRYIIGNFIGAAIIAFTGSIIMYSLFQNIVRDVLMWLMSPKIGTYQLSNVNLIAAFLGAYLAVYIVTQLDYKKKR